MFVMYTFTGAVEFWGVCRGSASYEHYQVVCFSPPSKVVNLSLCSQ